MNVSCHLYVAMAMLSATMVLSDNNYYYINNNAIPNSGPTQRDKVCRGLTNGLGLSGTYQQWYDLINSTYSGCTYVNGNLLLTWFQDANIDYDFNFLRKIRYVRGYVMIAVSAPRAELPLVNLEIIRGNRTYDDDESDAALSILMTNFTTIRLPKLIEISKGNVVARLNAPYQHIELSRSWDDIMRGRVTSDPQSLQLQSSNSIGINTPEWYSMCHESCPHRCFAPGEGGCCHSQCAASCYGPESYHCEKCKDYRENNDCVSHCSDPYFAEGSLCRPNSWYNAVRRR